MAAQPGEVDDQFAMSDVDRYLFLAFPFLFVAIWFAVISMLRNVAGMTRTLDVPGDPLRSSRWGSAVINGVNAKGCAKIDEYADGFVIRMMAAFGGGRLWLPKSGLQMSEQRPRRIIVPRSRVLISGFDQVILFDRLADFMADARSQPSPWTASRG